MGMGMRMGMRLRLRLRLMPAPAAANGKCSIVHVTHVGHLRALHPPSRPKDGHGNGHGHGLSAMVTKILLAQISIICSRHQVLRNFELPVCCCNQKLLICKASLQLFQITLQKKNEINVGGENI